MIAAEFKSNEDRSQASCKVIPMPPIYGAEEVYRKYADMVFRLALARCRKQSDAEDVLQDVFVRYVRFKPEFVSAEHQRAWLVKATLNCSNSLLRSIGRFRAEELNENTEAGEIDASDTSGDVYDAVMRLPKSMRTVVHLYYYEGYKISEIAKLTDSNDNTVKSRLRRAKEKLEKELKGDYFDV